MSERSEALVVEAKARFGQFVLDAAFTAPAGVTALFGRSGAGKTTLVGIIAGLRRPDQGRVVLDGRTLLDTNKRIDVPVHQRRIGVVFQEARLFPHLSVRRNLIYGAAHSSAAAFARVVDLLALAPLLDRRTIALSGGEAQRVAIGRALLSQPDLLIMDEPLSNLDGARKAVILPFLERLAREGEVPILYVSHVLDEVARLADSMVLLSEGRVAASGPLAEVLARVDLGPATGRYEASSILEGTVAGHDATYALSRVQVEGSEVVVPLLEAAPGTPVRLRVRARDVALALEAPAGISIRNRLAVTVASLSPEEGAFAEVGLALGDQALRARVTRQALAELGLREGASAVALIKAITVESPAELRKGR